MVVWNDAYDELVYCSGCHIETILGRCPECHEPASHHDSDRRKQLVMPFPFDNLMFRDDLLT